MSRACVGVLSAVVPCHFDDATTLGCQAAATSTGLAAACPRVDRRWPGGPAASGVVGERVTLDRSRHATRTGPAAAELGSLDRDHLDPVVPQPRVRLDVALGGDDHARRQCEHVVALLPLLPLGLVAVAAGLEQPH